jgi:parvulin-like peptidyl-prolyl isomerase
MPSNALTSERMACAVLAAQVAALRDRIDAGPTVSLLWQTSDLLARMAGLVEQLASDHPDLPPALGDDCASVLVSGLEMIQSIDGLAFQQAQRNDFTCQTVDTVVIALGRLAAMAGPFGPRLSADDLAALYVSEEQRDVHAVAARQFALGSGPSGSTGQVQHEGRGR